MVSFYCWGGEERKKRSLSGKVLHVAGMILRKDGLKIENEDQYSRRILQEQQKTGKWKKG